MKKLEVKILDERIRGMLPHYASAGAAGLDLRACIDSPLNLNPGDSQLVSSGIAIHVADPGYAAVILPRSGLGAKSADVFISVAAVADYRVKNPAAQKIKKANGHLSLELEENPDILAWVAGLAKPPFCVGFAAESENLAQNAKAKLARKKLPLIVGNLVQEELGRDESAITLFDANGEHPLGRGPKLELARKLVEHLAGKLPRRK